MALTAPGLSEAAAGFNLERKETDIRIGNNWIWCWQKNNFGNMRIQLWKVRLWLDSWVDDAWQFPALILDWKKTLASLLAENSDLECDSAVFRFVARLISENYWSHLSVKIIFVSIYASTGPSMQKQMLLGCFDKCWRRGGDNKKFKMS